MSEYDNDIDKWDRNSVLHPKWIDEVYRKFQWKQTTSKQNKVRTVCIILGMDFTRIMP